MRTPQVVPVDARDPAVAALVAELTAELAAEGYAPDQTFGYSLERLEAAGVLLRGVRAGDERGELVGIGGLELQDAGHGELKRFFVRPSWRGTGAAAAVLAALVAEARARGVRRLRLETGDRQHAALAFYRRHGFVDVPRFGPYVDSATSVCLQRELGTATDP